VVANYLNHFGDNEYVFKCFKFPSEEFDKKYVALFNKYLNDIRLPEDKRRVCGRHRGGKPSLGFEMDQLVFELLYERYLEPNEKKPIHMRVKVDNVKINQAVFDVLKSAAGENLFFLLNKDNKLTTSFQYCKTGCHRFAKRHFFQNRFISCPEEDEMNDKRSILCQSDYAIEKGYPVEGWKTPTVRYDYY
jgi:hypothetical protein